MNFRVGKNSEKGAVVVLVAVMLVLILTCIAFVVDLGHIHNVKTSLQEAVDAAALAGAAKLDGTSNQVQNAKDVAIATAKANGVTEVSFIDSECKTSDTESCVGDWDDEALGSSAADRWTYDGTAPNAVLVRASRAVNHIFFFFAGSTTVTADAIAISTPFNPVLPLAVVGCAATDKIAETPGALPPMTICDIRAYSFNVDPEDQSAWTSLTFDVNANQVSQYMQPGSGREMFNEVVFGEGRNVPASANDGIENTTVDTSLPNPFNNSYSGCNPNGLNIPCGLGGKINGDNIAPPGDFPVPSPLPALNQDTTTGIYSPAETSPGSGVFFDPMTDYGRHGGSAGYLPRWYNMNPDPGFQSDDHFTRVWSQDGVLLPGYYTDGTTTVRETILHYVNRLASYRDGTVKPYGDDRFMPGGALGDIIDDQWAGNIRNQILTDLHDKAQFDISGVTSTNFLYPNFGRVTRYAGYPKVFVFNGTAASILKDFLSNPDVVEDSHLKCRQDINLPPGQHALIVNVPVIFAGDCAAWKALSLGGNNNDQHFLTYVGMAKMLVTRVWSPNPGDVDCGDHFVDVAQDMDGNSCDLSVFDPPPNGSLLSIVSDPTIAIEGLNLYPLTDLMARQASLLKVELVE